MYSLFVDEGGVPSPLTVNLASRYLPQHTSTSRSRATILWYLISRILHLPTPTRCLLPFDAFNRNDPRERKRPRASSFSQLLSINRAATRCSSSSYQRSLSTNITFAPTNMDSRSTSSEGCQQVANTGTFLQGGNARSVYCASRGASRKNQGCPEIRAAGTRKARA